MWTSSRFHDLVVQCGSTSDETVIVRAHMNTTGYGDYTLRGNVKGGFVALTTLPDFAEGLAEQAPLQSSCTF